jgi:hypothetical protein
MESWLNIQDMGSKIFMENSEVLPLDLYEQ